MLVIVKKDIRGGICYVIHGNMKANKNTWKVMMKIKNHQILSIGR